MGSKDSRVQVFFPLKSLNPQRLKPFLICKTLYFLIKFLMVINMKRIFHLAIILFWVTTTALLIYRHAPVKSLDVEAHSLLPESRQSWMGIYFKGQKIGFSSSRFYRDVDGYSAYEEIKMRLTVLGTRQDVHTTTYVSLSPDLRVRSFRFSIDTGQRMDINGKLAGRVLTLDIETAGSKIRQTTELAQEPMMNLTILPYLLRVGFKTGARFSFPVFDPSTMSMQDLLLEIAGREKITISNREVDAFKIKGSLQGMPLLMWVDGDGNELKEESPMGFTLISESREEAMQAGGTAPDIIRQTSVPFNLALPSQVSYLKMRLKGIDFEGFELDGGRQTLKGDTVKIVKEDIGSFKHPDLPVPGMEEFLAETPFIQSKEPGIINLARQIIGKERNSFAAARLLYDWVFKNIKKTPSITVPSALDVLMTKKGDCNEHTTLYVALARSVGLPAKIIVGLVYREGAFYYHAWPEVYAGKWIPVDPTLGEFPADAKYLRLISGDLNKQLIIARVINNISLEGIEYR